VGSYASLTIGGHELFQTKSYVDPIAMTVFSERDRSAVLLVAEGETSNATPIPTSWTRSELDEYRGDGQRAKIVYRASSWAVAERLEAMGISLSQVRSAFERRLRERADEIADAAEDDDVSRIALAAMLRHATFLDWSSAFQEFMADDTRLGWPSATPKTLRTEMIRFIEEESEDDTFFGMPGDARWLLRAATEICGPKAAVEYDITELVLSGYYELNEPVAARAKAGLRREARHSAPLVVLTEGSTDAAALKGAVRLLAPHLVDYLTLLDFEATNAAGGVGYLVSAVRAFAAAGIVNRTVALFDNDVAGRAAIRVLERSHLPESIRVVSLPNLPVAREYPTRGPSGASIQNVNGRAASIELYFGEDVLRSGNGDLMPVTWGGRDTVLDDWQGEVIDKGELQRRFREKLLLAEGDPTLLDTLDWSGMRLIIDRILHAFLDPGLTSAAEPTETPP
jgi:hypothetical protein